MLLSTLYLVLGYFSAILPGVYYLNHRSSQDQLNKLVVYKKNVIVGQYTEFGNLWFFILIDLFKIILFTLFVASGSFPLFSGFMLGVLLPNPLIKTNTPLTPLYFLIFLFTINIWLCLLGILGLLFSSNLNISLTNFIFIVSLLLSLIFWLFNFDIILVIEALAFSILVLPVQQFHR